MSLHRLLVLLQPRLVGPRQPLTIGWWWRDTQISRKRLAVRFLTVKSPLYLLGGQLPSVLWCWHVDLLSQKEKEKQPCLVILQIKYLCFRRFSFSMLLTYAKKYGEYCLPLGLVCSHLVGKTFNTNNDEEWCRWELAYNEGIWFCEEAAFEYIDHWNVSIIWISFHYFPNGLFFNNIATLTFCS